MPPWSIAHGSVTASAAASAIFRALGICDRAEGASLGRRGGRAEAWRERLDWRCRTFEVTS